MKAQTHIAESCGPKCRSMGSAFRVVVVCLMMMGCSNVKTTNTDRRLDPADFASTPQAIAVPPPPPPPTENETTHSIVAATPELSAPPQTQTPWVSDRDRQWYITAAMIGQVNGRSLYSTRVLEPLENQLIALGQRLPRIAFERELNGLIARRLEEIIFNALILGEAERNLSQQEQMAVTNIIAGQRAELFRLWGLGSPAVTEQQLRKQTGKGIEETLEDSRQQIVVSRYMKQKILPKINVTRKDIERYYVNHPDQFNPAPSRTLRLMRVSSKEAAERIDQALAAGQAFAQIASKPPNLYRNDRGGLFGGPATGDKVLRQPLLNEAMLALNAGENSSSIPIEGGYWWVHVESIKRAPTRTLRKAQRDIERTLRMQRYHALTEQYRDRLFSDGSYSPSLDQMADVLMKVAMARYARAE